MSSRPALRLALVAGLVSALLSGCLGLMPGAPAPGGMGGITARIDQSGARLDKASALSLVNAYRSSVGVAPLMADPNLDARAEALASGYASSGRAPATPADAVAMRLSAGYSDFANTFSGWRNSPAEARVLAEPTARRAGVAAVYNPSSTYGVHWVLLLDE